MARLTLTEAGEDVVVGGNVTVIGTRSGGEVITLVHGDIILDGSFNAGGDTIRMPGNVASFTVRIAGSQAIFEGAGLRLTIPLGTVGVEIAFSDSTRTLIIDTASGVPKLGDQTLTQTATPVAPIVVAPVGLIGTEGNDTLTGTIGNDVIDGLGGNDSIDGGAGNDTIRGGLGNDTLWGSLGDDEIFGGAGADRISDTGGSSSVIDSGADNDWVVLSSWAGSSYRVTLGDGDDYIGTSILNPGSFTIDAGEGADRVMVSPGSTGFSITLGGGRDELVLPESALGTGNFGSVLVNDFETGAAGDKVEMLYALTSYLTNWSSGTNPFATGHLRLIDRSGAAVLQVDRDGAAGTTGTFKDLIVFAGDTRASFTAENFSGFDPKLQAQAATFVEEIGVGAGELFLGFDLPSDLFDPMGQLRYQPDHFVV